MIVLYAEDDQDDFEIFNEVVKVINPKAVCLHARDGHEALSILEGCVVLPDIIFLDINMPVMDGKKCLIEIRKNKKYNDIPVVIYTTSRRVNEMSELKNLGATDHLIKPPTFEEVHKVLMKYFAN